MTTMRIVDVVEEGALELNYMWLPTWLGQNTAFKQQMEKDLTTQFAGRPIVDLDAINEEAIAYICKKYPVPGLRDYLDGLKFIGQEG